MKKTFEVELTMFQNGKIRKVRVPHAELQENPIRKKDIDKDLQKIFYYGQNDFQNDPKHCSVSAGDIIRYQQARYLILPIGFKKLTNGGTLSHDPTKRISQLYKANND